jgi:thermostable 8-oxoguanine DNA glycosylase
MDGDVLTVGRAKVFSNVFKAGTDTDKKQLMDQYWEYLNQQKPDSHIKEYFKYNVSTWGDAAVRKIYIFGPYSYLQAQQLLRKEMKSTRSRDWLVMKIEGFGYYPNKFKKKN